MIITIANGKGGSGKTTIAVGLATLWAENESVLLADLDPQDAGSAHWWLDNANPKTMSWTKATGPQLEAAIDNLDTNITVIDTPPRLDTEELPIAAAISDLVLIVAGPSALDISAAAQTIAITQNSAPYLVCLTKVDPRSLNETHKAQQDLIRLGHPISPIIRHYAAIRRTAPHQLPTNLPGAQGANHLADLTALANRITATFQGKRSL